MRRSPRAFSSSWSRSRSPCREPSSWPGRECAAPPARASPMAAEPDVSVVVVTLNGRELVERCLDSVANSGELIVVDHGSTDGTVELVRERFPQARLIEQ